MNPRYAELWRHLQTLRRQHPTLTNGWQTVVLVAAWDWQDVDEAARIAALCPSVEAVPYLVDRIQRDARRRRVRLAAVELIEALDNGVETREALGSFVTTTL